ncbi:MAG: YdcF family protein [Verrucomicrobia bacterium]|nr:YdcF family protein [Verrucomicrobiota bacterium]
MSRFFSLLLDPISVLWLLLLLAAVVHLWKRQFRAALVPAVVAGLLSLTGCTWFSAGLLASLERPYARQTLTDLPAADALVVLGGWSQPSANDAFGLDFQDSVDRLLTAVELMRQGKARALVLAGGGYPVNGQAEAESVRIQQWLAAWRVAPAPIHRLGACRHTRDEAARAKALLDQHGWRRVLLVTSAAHLKRAEAVFKKVGVPVVAVACDFTGLAALETEHRFNPFPRTNDFEALATYLHERVGWWVYRVRGWV